MYKGGTIILVSFPFTDLSGSKVRPAVIVSQSSIGDDVVVLFISSKYSSIGRYDVVLSASKSNGLKVNSVVKCSKLATLDKKMILGELGTLEKKEMTQVGKKLKEVLGLC